MCTRWTGWPRPGLDNEVPPLADLRPQHVPNELACLFHFRDGQRAVDLLAVPARCDDTGRLQDREVLRNVGGLDAELGLKTGNDSPGARNGGPEASVNAGRSVRIDSLQNARVPGFVLLLRDRARTPSDPALQRYATPVGRLGSAAVARGLSGGGSLSVCHLGPQFDLRR